jgi:hypothetical protein
MNTEAKQDKFVYMVTSGYKGDEHNAQLEVYVHYISTNKEECEKLAEELTIESESHAEYQDIDLSVYESLTDEQKREYHKRIELRYEAWCCLGFFVRSYPLNKQIKMEL